MGGFQEAPAVAAQAPSAPKALARRSSQPGERQGSGARCGRPRKARGFEFPVAWSFPSPQDGEPCSALLPEHRLPPSRAAPVWALSHVPPSPLASGGPRPAREPAREGHRSSQLAARLPRSGRSAWLPGPLPYPTAWLCPQDRLGPALSCPGVATLQTGRTLPATPGSPGCSSPGQDAARAWPRGHWAPCALRHGLPRSCTAPCPPIPTATAGGAATGRRGTARERSGDLTSGAAISG